jgi:hypothetical protein
LKSAHPHPSPQSGFPGYRPCASLIVTNQTFVASDAQFNWACRHSAVLAREDFLYQHRAVSKSIVQTIRRGRAR